MLYLALNAAWKIVQDNQPDTQKDSILYAKFLTQTLAQKPNWTKSEDIFYKELIHIIVKQISISLFLWDLIELYL